MFVEPVIGIDLGTTFSCVSVYRKGKAEIIPDAHGERLIPSIVYFHPSTGEVSVGKAADELIPECPKNGLLDAKRFLGRSYHDEFISQYINSNQAHFSLVRTIDDQVAFEIEVAGRSIAKTPEEVCSEILKYLKQIASRYLGSTVRRAVISVPAYFSSVQRRATLTSAELAGLEVLKFITEPTAAALHYISNRTETISNMLVFDFGGGTLDVSLIRVQDTKLAVKTMSGDTLLGGRDFDEVLYRHIYPRFLKMEDDRFAARIFKRRLNNMCEQIKQALSSEERYTHYVDAYDGNMDMEITMERKEFEEINENIFERIMAVTTDCLTDSNVTETDIDDVVLVGGSTRIPKVRQLLSSHFGAEKIRIDVDPDEAVAAGASIQAVILSGDFPELERYIVAEVTPASLGIGIGLNFMDVFLPKNSPLPSKVAKTMHSCLNCQTSISLRIYEGEKKNTDYNNKLGEFRLDGLPECRAGDVEVCVEFNLDENGILDVTATETSTKISRTMTLEQFRLSSGKMVLNSLSDDKDQEDEDMFETFMVYTLTLKRICHRVLYDLETITPEVDQQFVEDCCLDFLDWMSDLDYTEVDVLIDQYECFKNDVMHILENYPIFQDIFNE